jgi:hypothetical protein
MGDGLTFTPANRTGCANCKKALVSGNLSCPAALTTRFRTGSRFTATAVTLGAYLSFFDLDLGFGTKSRIHKTKGQVIAQVSTSLCSCSGPPAAAKSKEIFENITEARKDIFKSAKT